MERYTPLLLMILLVGCSKSSITQPVPEEETPTSPSLSYLHFHTGNSSLTSDKVDKLWLYQDEFLILLTEEADSLYGLVKMEIETKQFEQIYCHKAIIDVEVDDHGPIYIATKFDGLIVINGTGTIVANYTPANSCLTSNYISAVASDESGMIYIGELSPMNLGTSTAHYVGSGLVRLDPSTSSCEIWHMDNSPLPANAILDIEVNAKGVWTSTLNMRLVYTTYMESFGSSGGLVHIQNDQWKTYTKNEYPQLISHLIFELKTVEGEELWFQNYFNSGLPRSYGTYALIRVNESSDLEGIGEHPMPFQTGVKDNFGRYVIGGRKSIPISQYRTESQPTLVVSDGELKYDFSEEIKDTMSIAAMEVDPFNTIWIGGQAGLFSVKIE